MRYEFKFWQEILWAVIVGAVIAALTMLVDFRPEAIQDWSTWAIAFGGAIARGAAAVALSKITDLLRGGSNE